MRYQLRNNHVPTVLLGLTSSVWYEILELAEENGWNPMGPIPSDLEEPGMILAGLGFNDANQWGCNYWSEKEGLVLFEDALNLADALERAILNYEPQYIPHSTTAQYLVKITVQTGRIPAWARSWV